MTDVPIPNEWRDQFVDRMSERLGLMMHTPEGRRAYLDELVGWDVHIELRLSEFAVHDDTCCGGAMFVCGQSGRSAACFRPRCENNRAPCPGAGYYHWTAK